MSYKVDNAVIMAAGASSRFAPLSYEMPKSLISVRGEVLIERQIRQLKEAGIDDIIIVTGYMKHSFEYLREKFGVTIVENDAYNVRNNNSTIYAVRDLLRNTYICSSDNYFTADPFEAEVDDSYYAALYADGKTNEWCMTEGSDGYVNGVTVGGENSWYMLGHTFWNEDFSKEFVDVLTREYDRPETADKLWEAIYAEHHDRLKMKIRRYKDSDIFEFDCLDELREFDSSYIEDTRSAIIKSIAEKEGCRESDIRGIKTVKGAGSTEACGFLFTLGGCEYKYDYKNKEWRKIH